MKVNIEEIENVLVRCKIDTKVVNAVIKELEVVAEENKQQNSGAPKAKNEYLIVLSDPNHELDGKEFTGWVTQIKQGDDAGLLLGKIKEAARNHIVARKRKTNAIDSIGDALMYVKRKWFKEKDVTIKTKEPVRVIITDNKL